MAGSWSRRCLRAGLLGGVLALQSASWAEAGSSAPPALRTRASTEVLQVLHWVRLQGDHQNRPFAVVDKRLARIHVYDAQGRLMGESPALLGATFGDHSVPGVGERAQTNSVRPDERTTPAGRFDAVPGRNLQGEAIVWVDYGAAFAIHRVRPGASQRPRQQRLATFTPDDNRASLGCVIVPVAFYEQVISPVLGTARSVVYVLPETRPLKTFLDGLAARAGG